MNNPKNDQRGFTLIELLIVVGIVAILAAVAMPSYRDYVVRSRVNEAQTASESVRTAVALYTSRHGSTPSALASLSYVSIVPNSHGGNYVSTVDVTKVGSSSRVTVVFNNDAGLGNASGGNIRYTATVSGSMIQWTTDSTNIAEKYWPKQY